MRHSLNHALTRPAFLLRSAIKLLSGQTLSYVSSKAPAIICLSVPVSGPPYRTKTCFSKAEFTTDTSPMRQLVCASKCTCSRATGLSVSTVVKTQGEHSRSTVEVSFVVGMADSPLVRSFVADEPDAEAVTTEQLAMVSQREAPQSVASLAGTMMTAEPQMRPGLDAQAL